MNEIKCPKCGSVFRVDEADYAAILSQVRNNEFQKEIERRMAEQENQFKARQETAVLKAEQVLKESLNAKEREMSQKETEIAQLREKYDLHMRAERYISDESGIPSSDAAFIRG